MRSLAALDLLGVPGKLLPQPDRRRVHQMRAADLDHVPELARFRAQRLVKLLQRGHQLVLQRLGRGDVDRRRDHVVARLPHVDVVVRMDGPLRADGLPGELRAAVRQHLVGVHVRAGARTGLEDVDGEMLIELAVDQFFGGLLDEPGLLGAHLAEFQVRAGGGRA